MIKAIAIDDEPIALDVIRSHAAKIPFVELKGCFLSATEALKYLQANEIDLVFLDVMMPDLTGIDFARQLPERIRIVFTTAFPEYAIEGFDLAATDYLLKPISLNRLLQACTRVGNQIQKTMVVNKSNTPLFVKDGYDLVQINPDDITHIEGGDNYVTIYHGRQRVLTRITLKEIGAKLDVEHFIRVHRSHIVALRYIEKIEKAQLVVDGKKIPLSPLYRNGLMLRLKLV